MSSYETSFNKNFKQWVNRPTVNQPTVNKPMGQTVTQRVGQSVAKGVVNRPTTKESTKETIQKKVKTLKAKNPSIKILLDYYHESFLTKFQTKPNLNGAKDGSIAKSLLSKYSLNELQDLMDSFFSSSDQFIQTTGYTMGVFSTQINKLVVDRTTGPPLPKKSEANRQMLQNLLKERQIDDIKKIGF